MLDAALAAEAEPKRVPFDRHMPPPQGGEPEGMVLARVLVVAHADQRAVEQAHHRREDLPPAQVGTLEVALDSFAQPRQHLAELQHATELGAVTRFAVRRVITVLLPPTGIARRRLDVAGGIGTDPDVGPGGRN